MLEEEVPTSSASWSGTLTSLLNTPLKIPPPSALAEGVSLRWVILSCEYLISLNRIHAHTCYQLHRGNGSQNLQGLSDFLQRLSNFPQRLSKILNSFSLSKKSKKIYLRREVYKRSLFELCIFCHSLSHSRSELRNTRYNTQQFGSAASSIGNMPVSILMTLARVPAVELFHLVWYWWRTGVLCACQSAGSTKTRVRTTFSSVIQPLF